MKTIVQTKHPMVIKYTLEIDNAYNDLVYDGSPSFEDFQPDVVNCLWFILVQDGHTAGMIKMDYLNNVMWVAHVVIFKKYRGSGSEEWGKQVAAYMAQNLGAKKILAITPYEAAKKYAEKIGFEYLTTLKSSIQKNGVLLSQWMLELTVGEMK